MKKFSVGNKTSAMKKAPVEIIAEAGVNHNGSLDRALELVDVAAQAGADVVKFQTFNAEALVTEQAPMAEYQQQNTGLQQSQLEMLKKLELPFSAYRELLASCQSQGIEFMSSPFDGNSLRFLTDELGVRRLKIASGEITNGPLLLEFARSGCRLILSTGMSELDEIRLALGVLAYGMLEPQRNPTGIQAFNEALETPEAQQLLQQRVTLLHCTSQYPTPVDQVNLAAMQTLRESFGLATGYSDHTAGITIAIAAAALGASVIEKHFTLDKALPGPDHKASLEPRELQQMVAAVHEATLCRGDGLKRPQPCEWDTRTVARKSLVAAEPIAEGQLFDASNLKAQRPGKGVSPMSYWDYLQQPAQRGYPAGSLIDE